MSGAPLLLRRVASRPWATCTGHWGPFPRRCLLGYKIARCRPSTTQSTPSAAPAPAVEIQAPLPVRAGLVGASTALMTPVFPIIGFNQFVFRFCDASTRMLIHGGTSMLYLSAMVIAPKAFYYAPVLLPFALGNGLVAGVYYLFMEKSLGGPTNVAALKLFNFIPVAGPLLGLGTALTVPFVYPVFVDFVFPSPDDPWGCTRSEEVYSWAWWCVTDNIMAPCFAVTGLVAGCVLQFVLEPVILGLPGVPWQKLAGTILAGLGIGCCLMYSTVCRERVSHLTDINVSDPRYQGWFFPDRATCYINGLGELCWCVGLDHNSGLPVSELREPVRTSSSDGKHRFIPGPPSSRVHGIDKAVSSRKLAEKAVDRRVECYASERTAWVGLLPVPRQQLSWLVQALPQEEVLLRDALVCFIVQRVAPSIIRNSLENLGKQLEACAGWMKHPRSLVQQLDDLRLEAARFRELQRLRMGASPGPVSAEALRASLVASPIVDLQAIEKAVQSLNWQPDMDARRRQEDWHLLKTHEAVKQRRELQLQVAIVVGGLLAVGLHNVMFR